MSTVMHPAPTYTPGQLLRYMLRLGTVGFGGPVALAGYMRRDLVERWGWISEADYKEGLTLAQLAHSHHRVGNRNGPPSVALQEVTGAGHCRCGGAVRSCRLSAHPFIGVTTTSISFLASSTGTTRFRECRRHRRHGG